jgi:hypothetical protein
MLIFYRKAEQVCSFGNTSDLHLESVMYESQPGYWLLW